MPRYRNRRGVVVERDEGYVSAFPPGTFTLVTEETPLTQRECCGGDKWVVPPAADNPAAEANNNDEEKK